MSRGGRRAGKPQGKRRGPKGNVQGFFSDSELGLLSLRIRDTCRLDPV